MVHIASSRARGPAVIDLVAGRVDVMIVNVGNGCDAGQGTAFTSTRGDVAGALIDSPRCADAQ